MDNDISLISSHFKLRADYQSMFAYITTQANNLITLGREEELLDEILLKYHQLTETHDFVLCEGTDYTDPTAPFEFDINAAIATNLGAPVILVANAFNH